MAKRRGGKPRHPATRDNLPDRPQRQPSNHQGATVQRDEQVMRAEYYSGPLPPAEYFEKLEQIMPGFTKMFIDEWREQGAHRQAIEKAVIGGDLRSQTRGQWMGLVVALTGLAAAVVLGLAGHTGVAAIIAALDLVSLVTVFVIGRARQSRSIDD